MRCRRSATKREKRDGGHRGELENQRWRARDRCEDDVMAPKSSAETQASPTAINAASLRPREASAAGRLPRTGRPRAQCGAKSQGGAVVPEQTSALGCRAESTLGAVAEDLEEQQDMTRAGGLWRRRAHRRPSRATGGAGTGHSPVVNELGESHRDAPYTVARRGSVPQPEQRAYGRREHSVVESAAAMRPRRGRHEDRSCRSTSRNPGERRSSRAYHEGTLP